MRNEAWDRNNKSHGWAHVPAPLFMAVIMVAAGESAASAAPVRQVPSPAYAASAPSGLPVPSISGPLRIAANIPLHLHWSTFEGLQPQPVVAEAPNGAVFVSTGSVIYVVDGDGPPEVAEHAGAHVTAMAADATDLYVETGLTVTDYNRQTGDQVRTWALPVPSKSPCPHCTPAQAGLLAEPGALWSWTDYATDSSGFLPATLSRLGAFGVKLVDVLAYPAFMVANSGGLYYEADTAEGQLAHVTPSGVRTLSPWPFDIDSPISLVDGTLVAETVQEPGGEDVWQTWGPSTLRPLTWHPANSAVLPGMWDTGAGLLGYLKPTGPIAPDLRIGRLSPATGEPSESVQFFSNFSWTLEGYYPAIVNEESGELYVVRFT
jgi:hypothetical protein